MPIEGIYNKLTNGQAAATIRPIRVRRNAISYRAVRREVTN